MPRARTMAKCVIGVVRQSTTLKNVTPLATVNTAYDVVMMGLTASAPMTFATSLKIARSTLLTLTSNVATVLPLTMTVTSKGR